jgi:hypothetical protein
VDRSSQEAGVLLACVALALLVLIALASHMARLGAAIAREVRHAQADYTQGMAGDIAETNALLLGHCLRREMLKSVAAGFLRPDAWAFGARIRALPTCTRVLPPLPPPAPPLITTPRFRPIVTSAPAVARPYAQRTSAHLHGR